DRVASAAAQDVPSVEPGQCLRSRAASPHDRQAIGPHPLGYFSLREKKPALGLDPGVTRSPAGE
ncbi:MAG: hypothetical protein WBP11_12030, partial [Dokdonella sp.]